MSSAPQQLTDTINSTARGLYGFALIFALTALADALRACERC